MGTTPAVEILNVDRGLMVGVAELVLAEGGTRYTAVVPEGAVILHFDANPVSGSRIRYAGPPDVSNWPTEERLFALVFDGKPLKFEEGENAVYIDSCVNGGVGLHLFEILTEQLDFDALEDGR